MPRGAHLKITPTPLTAALAGIVAALVWPWAWMRFGATSGGNLELIAATLLVIVLPAHAFVVGFGRNRPASEARTMDTALLKRIAAWLLAALATTGVRAVAGL